MQGSFYSPWAHHLQVHLNSQRLEVTNPCSYFAGFAPSCKAILSSRVCVYLILLYPFLLLPTLLLSPGKCPRGGMPQLKWLYLETRVSLKTMKQEAPPFWEASHGEWGWLPSDHQLDFLWATSSDCNSMATGFAVLKWTPACWFSWVLGIRALELKALQLSSFPNRPCSGQEPNPQLWFLPSKFCKSKMRLSSDMICCFYNSKTVGLYFNKTDWIVMQ